MRTFKSLRGELLAGELSVNSSSLLASPSCSRSGDGERRVVRLLWLRAVIGVDSPLELASPSCGGNDGERRVVRLLSFRGAVATGANSSIWVAVASNGDGGRRVLRLLS